MYLRTSNKHYATFSEGLRNHYVFLRITGSISVTKICSFIWTERKGFCLRETYGVILTREIGVKDKYRLIFALLFLHSLMEIITERSLADFSWSFAGPNCFKPQNCCLDSKNQKVVSSKCCELNVLRFHWSKCSSIGLFSVAYIYTSLNVRRCFQ